MLPKKNRLTVPQFFKNPHRLVTNYSTYFMCLVKDGEQLEVRIVCQVPKVVDKRSTIRNHLKRLIITKLHQNINSLPHNKEILIKVQKKVLRENQTDFYNDLQLVLTKSKLISKEMKLC